MGHTTGRRHLRRLAAPRTWPIPRKVSYWIVKPSPGPHSMELSMPIALWIRDYLKYVKTMREVRYVLNNKKVYVDGKPIKDYKYPVGLFDVIYFPDLNEYWRVLINRKGKLYLKQIDEKEAKIKPLRIKRKQMIDGGKIQLTLFDGRNVVVEDPKKYKTGDTLVIDLENKKIIEHIPMEKGVTVFFYYGAKVGTLGILEDVRIEHRSYGHTRFVVYKDYDTNETKETIWDYAYVVGRDKPVISVL